MTVFIERDNKGHYPRGQCHAHRPQVNVNKKCRTTHMPPDLDL